EHSVGYGFRDLVAAVPPEELVVAADETTNEAARQRAFARRYLEKLINIEVEVPRLHDSTLQTMFGGSANADESALGDGASWLRTSKRVARESVQIARVGLVTFALGIGLAWAMDHFPSTGPTSPAPSRPAAAAPAPSSAAKSPTSKPTGSEEPAAIAFATVQEKSVSPTSEIPSDRRWVWWGPSTLVFGIAVLFGAALLVHRKPVIRDSDEFRKALEAVRPLFKAMNSTPRTIKRYQNRMRYLAASG